MTVLLVLGVVIGFLFDFLAPYLLLMLTFVLIWHLNHLLRLKSWLATTKTSEIPEARGIWGEVFNYIYHLQQRNRSQKKKLAAALTRFQNAASALPDGIIILASHGEIEWCNGAAEKLLGISYKSDSGQLLTNLIRTPAFLDYFAQGNFSEPHYMASPKNVVISLLIRVVPYGNEQKLFIARDMSRLLRLEQMRKDFIANISHELKTPITVLTGYLELMSEEFSSADNPWRESFEAMHQQAIRMQSIVEDLLLLSRLEIQHQLPVHENVNVAKMLLSLVVDAGIFSGAKQHQITLEADQSLWLKGNKDELHSAFSNIILNAVRYTPELGLVKIKWCVENDLAVFSVEDSGIGIAAHEIPRLTERFYRADAARSRETGGTGLGLAIVKHVLVRHGADLVIESELTKGSQFKCCFAAKNKIIKTSSL